MRLLAPDLSGWAAAIPPQRSLYVSADRAAATGGAPDAPEPRREWSLTALGETLAEIGSTAAGFWAEIVLIIAFAVCAVLARLVLSLVREIKAQRRYEASVRQFHEAGRGESQTRRT